MTARAITHTAPVGLSTEIAATKHGEFGHVRLSGRHFVSLPVGATWHPLGTGAVSWNVRH